MRKISVVALIIAMLSLSLLFLNWSGMIKFYPSWVQSPQFPHLKSLILNRQGNQQLKTQNYNAAFDIYVKTLEFDPFASEIHLDLGLSYEGQQQAEKAIPSYQNALKYAKNDEMKFFSLFNHAQLLGKTKKVDEALEIYQKALAFDPTSKEVKTNIELLIQMQQQQQKDDQNKDKNQDPKDNKDNKDKQDPKDSDSKDKKDPGKDDKDKKDKDDKDDKDKKDKSEKPRQYDPNQKYKPRPFKGKELSEGDVKKILGEIKQQEQKIRSEYNRKEVKEQPRDKDW